MEQEDRFHTVLKHHIEVGRTDQEGGPAGHRIVLAEVLEGLHTVLVGDQEGHQKIATGGGPWVDLEVHRDRRAAGGMVNAQEVRHRVVAGTGVVLEGDTAARSLVEDIRNSCCVLLELRRYLRRRY